MTESDPWREAPPLHEHRSGPLRLESGETLPRLVQRYALRGRLDREGHNLVVLFHSLTGRPDPDDGWPGLVGPGRAVDTRRWAVLVPNLLGSCYGTEPPPPGIVPTPRDMAAAVRRILPTLGVRSVALAAGGSLGGMVALEWAASFPTLTRAVVALAAPAAHTAQAIAFNHLQREAVRLGGRRGLALARMMAMTTYRTGEEMEERFGRERRRDGTFQVRSYLDHQGRKLVDRFDPASYVTLLDAMDAHDVGRGRGGTGPALRRFRGTLTGVGIPGDLLYPASTVQAWTLAAGARYRQIRSTRGHDAFLLEAEQTGALLREALEGVGSEARTAEAGSGERTR